jgi:hypothetical protein
MRLAFGLVVVFGMVIAATSPWNPPQRPAEPGQLRARFKEIVIAAIVAGAVLLAAAAMIYFSPYEACVRAWNADYIPSTTPVKDRPALKRVAVLSCAPHS